MHQNPCFSSILLFDRRGVILFEQKALNCQSNGGVAAIIYNNEKGIFAGTLGSLTRVTIPVVGVSQDDGLELLQQHTGSSVTLESQDGYLYADGTSFASPHVAATAAAIWQNCPFCTSNDVQTCLETTAVDLGSEGRDSSFGFGLVQVEDAYLCLVDTIRCCDESGTFPPVASPLPETPLPTRPITCSEKEEAYRQCFENSFTSIFQESICRTCINDAVPEDISNSSCAETESRICRAVRERCPCGSCADDIELYLACITGEATNEVCQIDCNSVTPDPGDQPAPSPVDEHFCQVFKDEMQDCLFLEVSALQKDVCTPSCIMHTFPEGFQGLACFTINKEICMAIEECYCERCESEIAKYVDCVIDANTAGCGLKCQGLDFAPSMSPIQVVSVPSAARVQLLRLALFCVGGLIIFF